MPDTAADTRDDLAEALTNLAHYAARQAHRPDCERWVTAHERINALLDTYERTPA